MAVTRYEVREIECVEGSRLETVFGLDLLLGTEMSSNFNQGGEVLKEFLVFVVFIERIFEMHLRR